jgi:hypothetical protein
MSKFLLKACLALIFLVACHPTHHAFVTRDLNNPTNSQSQSVPSELMLADTAGISQNDSMKHLSLMDLPQTEDGQIVLADGFYEADFKSYCLQPGTPSPSDKDAYRQGPLTGYRKDIIETILRNSLKKPELEQKNIQLLLWSVVSGSDYRKLSWEVQSTAQQLLSSKQIFELKGGVIGVVKTVSEVLPGTGSATIRLKQLFELGTSSYELFERIAVLEQTSTIAKTTINKDQWYQQPDGYYLRYFPNGYQHVKIQVYVPEGTTASKKNPNDYLLFDPVTMMAIPTYSNSQRLGIGAPVLNIIRTIIEVPKVPGNPKIPPVKTVKTINPKTAAK